MFHTRCEVPWETNIFHCLYSSILSTRTISGSFSTVSLSCIYNDIILYHIINYRISRKFGTELNLAVGCFLWRSPNLFCQLQIHWCCNIQFDLWNTKFILPKWCFIDFAKYFSSHVFCLYGTSCSYQFSKIITIPWHPFSLFDVIKCIKFGPNCSISIIVFQL